MRAAWAFFLMCGLAFFLTACGRTDGTGDTGITGPVMTDTRSNEIFEGGAGAGDDSALPPPPEEERNMKIQVTDGSYTVVFALNGSPAAKSLYEQLPLTVGVENYSDNEKIFYPKALDTSGAVDADAKRGTLAYFSPWGDVVMYYKDFGAYSGLYELGQAVSGCDAIESLSGTLDITAVE